MKVELRKRKPYTCRFSIAGKVCAAYLSEDDTDMCPEHRTAVERFAEVPAKAAGAEKDEPVVMRRIWP